MSDLENKVFNTISKPNIHLRYVDDILLLTNSTDEINIIQETFQNNSFLNSTQEININYKIPYTSNIDRFTTSTLLLPKDPFSTCPWEQTSCLLCELGIEFSVRLWVILNTIMHGPPYCILPTFFDFTTRVSNCCLFVLWSGTLQVKVRMNLAVCRERHA